MSTHITVGSKASAVTLCDDADLDLVFGKRNVDKWADLNNDKDTTAILAVRARAREDATNEIYDLLRGGPYAIPFTSVPSAARRQCSKLAGVLLYEGRGVMDTTDEDGKHRLRMHKKEVYTWCRRIRGGQIRLDLADACPTYPQVLESSEDSINTIEELMARFDGFQLSISQNTVSP